MIKLEEIEKYLVSTGKFKKATNVRELKGGLLNHTYFASTDIGPVVIKQYGETIRDLPEFKLPEGRYETEKNTYNLFKEILTEKINSEIYYFDNAQKIIVMEFLDDSQRVDRVCENIPPEKFIDLGKVLAEIVNKTYKKDDLLPQFNGEEFQELKYHHRYYLHIENSQLYRVRDELMEQFRKNRVAVMHGDPRFNNMFYTKDQFYFIDYEGAYFADVTLDIAYLLAEVLIYFYEFPQNKYGDMAENLWKGFIENLTIDIDKKDLEMRVVKHAAFALIDKVKGEVIKGDYPFVKDRVGAEKAFEQIIINDDVSTVFQLIGILSYVEVK
jgi:5-methylthioribose kinase